MTTHTPAPAQEAVLTDDEIRSIWVEHGLDDEAVEDFARAIESALLSKLRAPKPLGDSCHHCGWMDWVSQDGQAYCQACGKPHGSVPAEGLPNLPELLRENADLDEAEGGNPQVCSLERDAADEIERLRREVAKLRVPVADDSIKQALKLVDELRHSAFSRGVCPDSGACHHNCVSQCARQHELGCVPLGVSGLGDDWKLDIERGASAPVAGEAQPTDEQIHRLAFDAGVVFGNTEEGAECWEFESPSLREFALALLSRHAAPQASEDTSNAADVDELRRRVLSEISTFAGMAPEPDESWDVWYCAAFDMLGSNVRNIFSDALDSTAAPQASEAQCSCPSGDGSLRHPCAVHPQASEAVRDSRAVLEAWQAVCDRIVDQYSGVVAGVDFAALGRANRAAMENAAVRDWTAILPQPHTDMRYHGEFVRGWNQCLQQVHAALSAQPGAQKNGGQQC